MHHSGWVGLKSAKGNLGALRAVKLKQTNAGASHSAVQCSIEQWPTLSLPWWRRRTWRRMWWWWTAGRE